MSAAIQLARSARGDLRFHNRLCVFILLAGFFLGGPDPRCLASSVYDAVRNDDLAALARILKSSPPDTVNSVLPGKITPLHLAAALNRVPIANYLLLNGADVNAVTENGFTPLHWAAARDSVEVLQLLLARGADPNIRADAGITPAHWAAAQNATNALRILISSGADCQAKTTQGLTPLHWALSNRAREAAAMLASHVATHDSESDTARPIARPDEKLPPWREAPPAQSLSAAAIPGQPLPIHGNVFNLALGFGETITFVWIEPAELWVSKTEITNAQYRRFAPDHDSKFHEKYSLNEPEQPAVFVGWYNAKAFCEWLNRNFAMRLPPNSECRLPTAAEWALLAGCEKQRVYPWGNDWPPRHGNFADTSAHDAFPQMPTIDEYYDGHVVSAPVSKVETNEWGLAGMAGNVWEWCEDWHDQACRYKKRMGGGWDSYHQIELRLDSCGFDLPSVGDATIGFRVVIAVSKVSSTSDNTVRPEAASHP